RLRAPPSAGHHHGRRTHCQSAADLVYHPGDLPGLCAPGESGEQGEERESCATCDACGGCMNLSALFIHRPAGTTLLTIALALAGLIAYQFLPVAPLPQVALPTMQGHTRWPG